MSSGINLASRPLRTGKAVAVSAWLLVIVALTASGLNLTYWLRGHAVRAELRREVEQRELRLGGLERELSVVRRSLDAPPQERIVRRLVAVERSGALGTVNPEEVLSLLAEALPEGVRILSVELEAGPSAPDLRIAAEVAAPHLVAELLSGLSRSRLVARAGIEQEVHRGDGEIYLRIEAQLSSAGE